MYVCIYVCVDLYVWILCIYLYFMHFYFYFYFILFNLYFFSFNWQQFVTSFSLNMNSVCLFSYLSIFFDLGNYLLVCFKFFCYFILAYFFYFIYMFQNFTFCLLWTIYFIDCNYNSYILKKYTELKLNWIVASIVNFKHILDFILLLLLLNLNR